MKSFAIATVLASAAAVANAQLTYDETTGVFHCAVPDGAYCAGDSLQTNIIVRCTDGIGQPGNCNDNLAGVPPIGVKTFAPCYQSTPLEGDAACSYAGVAYPDHGDPYPVPGYGISSSVSPTGYPQPSSSVEYPPTTNEYPPSSVEYPPSTIEYPPATTEYPPASSTDCTTSEVPPPPPYSSKDEYPTSYPPPPPYPTTKLSTSYYVSPTPYPTGNATSTVYPTGSHSPTPSTPPAFPGAASQVFISGSLAALIPLAGLFAMLF